MQPLASDTLAPAVIMALALLVLPWIAAALVVAWARRRARCDVASAWFGGMQWLQWLAVAGMLLTISAMIDSPLRGAMMTLLTAWLGEWGSLAAAVLALAPVASVVAATALASHALASATRGTDLARAEVIAQSGWEFASLAGLWLGLSGGAFVAAVLGRALLAPLVFAAGVALSVLAKRQVARVAGAQPIAVTQGELRERVFALAAKAGVRLQQLYVVPMRRSRMANAFAVKGDVVVLTDWLLEHLDRREVDAVLAHELAHLKLGHPGKLAWTMVLGVALSAAALSVSGATWALPVSALVAVLLTRWASRGFEGEADALGARLCGDPESLMTALVRLAGLNHVPMQWSAAAERTLTHPSTERRVRAIGAANGFTLGRIEQLLASPAPPASPYRLPAAVTGEGRIFSTAWKTASALRTSWLLLAASGLAPVLVLAVTRWLAWPRPAAFALALAVTFALVLAATDALAARGIAALRARFKARRRPREGAHFIGLAPGPDVHVYEGFYDWDLGFLAFDGDELVYEGEEVSLRIPRAAIERVGIDPGPPGWIAAPRVSLSWSAYPEGRSGTLLVRPAGVLRLSHHARASRALAYAIGRWHMADTCTPRAWAPLPPAQDQVTATPVARMAAPATLVAPVIVVAMIAALGCSLLALPYGLGGSAGWLDACAAGALTLALQRVPLWRAHGASAAANAPSERRKAA